MKESKLISLLTREISNELNAEDKARLADFANNPELESTRASISNVWESSSSYMNEADIDVNLAFDKFAAKYSIPVSTPDTLVKSGTKSQSLFLKVAAAIIILAGILFTISKLSVNSHSVFNDTNKVAQYALSEGLNSSGDVNSTSNMITLTPGSNYYMSNDNEVVVEGKAQFSLSNASDVVVTADGLELSLTESGKTSSSSNKSSNSVNSGTKSTTGSTSNAGSTGMTSSTTGTTTGSSSTASAGDSSNEADLSNNGLINSANMTNFDLTNIKDNPSVLLEVQSGMISVNDGSSNQTIKAGQSLNYNKETKVFTIGDVNPKSFQWSKKILSFDNTPIVEVFEDMEQYFNIKIDIDGTIPSECHFTAQNMKDPSIKDVLSTLHTSFNLGVERTSLKGYKVSNISCK